MKALSLLKWLVIPLATVGGLFLGASLFLRSETGRNWATARVLGWIQEEYGVSIQFQSLTFETSAGAWDVSIHSLLWKVLPEAPGQAIDELKISVSPARFLLKKSPVTAIVIKGLIIKPDIANDALHLRGAGLTLQRSQLNSWLKADSGSKDVRDWPSIRLETTRVELGYEGESLMNLEFSGQWTPDEGFDELNLETPAVDLARLTEITVQLIPDFAERMAHLPRLVKGRLENVQIACLSGFACQGSANIRHASWLEKGLNPGVSELSARLDFGPQQLNMTIPHATRTLTWSALYKKKIPVNVFGMRLHLRLEKDAVVLSIPKTEGTWNRTPFELEAALNIPREHTERSRIQLNLRSPQLTWSEVRSVLPDALLSQGLHEWLMRRIQRATLKNFSAGLEGLLVDFPFAKKHKGRLTLDADILAGQLNYHDAWPLLKNCQGRFLMRNAAIGIDGIRCQSSGLTATQGKLELPDIQGVKPELFLSLQVKDSLEAATQFLQKTPLRAIAGITDSVGLRAGLQTSTLSLQVPLNSKAGQEPFQLEGRTRVTEALWALPRDILKGTMRNLVLDYDQMGLKNLLADIRHGKERAQLTVQRDDARTQLDLKLKPLDEKNGLGVTLQMTPADQPTRIEGQIAGLALAEGAARLTIESLQWQGTDRPLRAKGRAEIQDFGRMWSGVGMGEGFRGGQGLMTFDLQLPGNFSMDNPRDLDGILDFDLKDGRIEQLSSTAKALINVANLKILGVGSGTVAYPYLRGRLVFHHGTLFTEDSVLGLGALEVEARGSVDYPRKSMDLQLTVVPDLGSPATSLAIGLWNPLVGLGLWGYSKLQGKASDSRLNRLASQSYRMKGPIAKPEISLISLLHLKEVLPWTQSHNRNGAAP